MRVGNESLERLSVRNKTLFCCTFLQVRITLRKMYSYSRITATFVPES